MSVYNYENITYHVSGMSVINDPKDTKQEGLLIYLRKIEGGMSKEFGVPPAPPLSIFLDKRDCAHIAKTFNEGRHFWKRFRLPKMIKQ